LSGLRTALRGLFDWQFRTDVHFSYEVHVSTFGTVSSQ